MSQGYDHPYGHYVSEDLVPDRARDSGKLARDAVRAAYSSNNGGNSSTQSGNKSILARVVATKYSDIVTIQLDKQDDVTKSIFQDFKHLNYQMFAYAVNISLAVGDEVRCEWKYYNGSKPVKILGKNVVSLASRMIFADPVMLI